MNREGSKVFVTGGSGFIGSHLIDKLIKEGYEVTALVRKTSDLSFLPLEKVKLVKGDIREFASLKEGISGCVIVFHVAAFTSDWGKESDFYEINVKGTRNVLRAANESDIKNVVLISTVAVLGEEDCAFAKSEESPYNPKMSYFLSRFFESDMNYYRYTKMLAEKEAISFSKNNGINLTVIRPVWVYGPREFHAGPYEFCRSVAEGCRILPMGKNNKFHVIYVKDLIDAIIKAAEKKLIGINIFNIGNTEVSNIREYFNLFCQHLEIKTPFYIPFAIAYPLGIILEAVAKLKSACAPFLLTRARVKMFYCNNIYSVTKSRKILGFSAETPLDEGIRETVDWWKENGYLRKIR